MVNDYYLALLPKLLRDEGLEGPVYFFWHIPFPPYFILRFLPERREILEGMLGADVIGFHTQYYVNNFLECVREILGAFSEGNTVYWNGRRIEVRAVPIGIDVGRWERLRKDPKVVKYARNLRKKLGVEFVGMGVDRLDYTKGLGGEVQGTGEVLRKVPLLQIAAPNEDEARGVHGRQEEDGRDSWKGRREVRRAGLGSPYITTTRTTPIRGSPPST